jgi:multiple sugar transport system permease protein
MTATELVAASPVLVDPQQPSSPRRKPKNTPFEGHVSRGWQIVLTLGMVVAAVYFLLPVYWLLVASTKSTSELFTTWGLWFSGDFSLFDNIAALSSYDGGIYWRWTLNSVVYSVFGSVLTTIVSALTGYALAIYQFRGRKIILGAVLGSLLVPGTVLAQPTYVLLVGMGLNNTYAGLLLPALVYPFGVLLCYIYAQSAVPLEIVEAARIDGAGEFRIFGSIAIRMMMTGMVTVLLFAFLGSWNSYMLPLLVLTDQELMPLTVGLTGWNQASITIPGLQILTVVGSMLSIIPIAIVFVSLQRYWRSGLAAGGVRF